MRKIIVGISGASGSIYGIKVLEALKDNGAIETHLVVSKSAEITITEETEYNVDDVKKLAHQVYSPDNMAASISSGSFITDGMIISPCSIKSLSSLANSYNENLITRAGDVCLKEKRKLVLIPRETPLHSGHLEILLKLSNLGALILPPFPAFYHHPKSIDDIVNHTVGKCLDQFSIQHNLFKRWERSE